MFKTFSMWNVSNILDAGWRVSMEECRWALTRRVPSGEVGDFVIGLLGTREPLARLRCNRAVVQSAWFVAVIGILRLALGFAGSGALSNTLKQCTATKPRWRRRLRSGRFPDGHRLSGSGKARASPLICRFMGGVSLAAVGSCSNCGSHDPHPFGRLKQALAALASDEIPSRGRGKDETLRPESV
jgi:hypothetical protein